MRQSTRKFLCPRVPLEAFIGSQSYVCNGELALFALGRLRFRPLRREKARKAAALERARRRGQFWWVDAGRFRGNLI